MNTSAEDGTSSVRLGNASFTTPACRRSGEATEADLEPECHHRGGAIVDGPRPAPHPYSPTGTDICTRRQSGCTVGSMATMNISAARESLPDAVELARTEAVFLERYGRPAAVLVSPERYEKLVAAFEDAEDAAAFDAAMIEEGPNIPWDQVKVDLGWT